MKQSLSTYALIFSCFALGVVLGISLWPAITQNKDKHVSHPYIDFVTRVTSLDKPEIQITVKHVSEDRKALAYSFVQDDPKEKRARVIRLLELFKATKVYLLETSNKEKPFLEITIKDTVDSFAFNIDSTQYKSNTLLTFLTLMHIYVNEKESLTETNTAIS